MDAATLPLAGMAPPGELVRTETEGRVVITSGSRVLYVFDADDVEMRNLAIASLREAGVSGVEVAALFGFTDRYVSAIRTRVQREVTCVGLDVAVPGGFSPHRRVLGFGCCDGR